MRRRTSRGTKVRGRRMAPSNQHKTSESSFLPHEEDDGTPDDDDDRRGRPNTTYSTVPIYEIRWWSDPNSCQVATVTRFIPVLAEWNSFQRRNQWETAKASTFSLQSNQRWMTVSEPWQTFPFERGGFDTKAITIWHASRKVRNAIHHPARNLSDIKFVSTIFHS